MRILFLGDIGIGQTSRMRMRAFARLGHTVKGVDTNDEWKRAAWLSRQVQRRLQRGSIPRQINAAVLKAARAFRPDLVWGEKQEFVRHDTILQLRRLGARVVHFTPDPYFYLRSRRTRIMDQAIDAFDVMVYCKSYERKDYEALGKPLIYMPLGFCDEVHRPLPSTDPRWNCMVGFVGGWDPRRERYLRRLAAAKIDLKIWGVYWDFLRDGRWSLGRYLVLRQLGGAEEKVRIHRDELLARDWQGNEIYADDYAHALTGTKIGLGFLRTVWPDQHTTRTFEIPACGSMLLADRTAEHQEFFAEGKEADFFGSEAEFVDKVQFYCANEPARARIATAGHCRCMDGRYAYVHRLKNVLEKINAL
jgi:spore maturation protein CgeB